MDATLTDRSKLRARARENLSKISELERSLEDDLREWERNLTRNIAEKRRAIQAELRSAGEHIQRDVIDSADGYHARSILSAPFIYAMIVPIAFLDLCFSFYQTLCFRLYGIERVDRRAFVAVDRHHLEFLNPLEKLNCAYCGYSNGVLAFTREIAARTEQYWCPIKHARRVLGPHDRYAAFVEFGGEDDYQDALETLRSALRYSDTMGTEEADAT
jgi:hypothetical protein